MKYVFWCLLFASILSCSSGGESDLPPTAETAKLEIQPKTSTIHIDNTCLSFWWMLLNHPFVLGLVPQNLYRPKCIFLCKNKILI